MTPENFTYWLQGFFEVQNPSTLDEVQTQIIKDNLALVFKKETPNYSLNQNSTYGGIKFINNDDIKISVWDKNGDWNQIPLNSFCSTGASIDFTTALEDYKKDGNVSKHGTIGFIAGPNGGNISTNYFADFLEKTKSGQNVPPLPTNKYFGGEYQTSIDPSAVWHTC